LQALLHLGPDGELLRLNLLESVFGHEWLARSEALLCGSFKQRSGQWWIYLICSQKEPKLAQKSPESFGAFEVWPWRVGSRHFKHLLSGRVERQGAAVESCDVKFLVGGVGAGHAARF
jgi:hypothetical protein